MNDTTVTERACLHPVVKGDTVFFDRAECVAVGEKFHEAYSNNQPFPHYAFENFLPKDILRRAVDEFPEWREGRFNDATSRKKTGYQTDMIESPFLTNLIAALNSSQFLGFVEKLTGIEGIITDPHQAGGGVHETLPGGHLSVHADFNIHPGLRLHRRLNIILFLNENWDESYGGALELWSTDMAGMVKAVQPEMGTAVIFNTTDDSYHGHPDPLTAPEGVTRRSIALYYYTASKDSALPEQHSTVWRVRPGSGDEVDGALGESSLRRLAKDWLPPAIMRRL